MDNAKHLTTAELEAGLEHILESPKNGGALKLIVYRPDTDQREVVQQALLDAEHGLVGDNWLTRGSSSTPITRKTAS